MCETLQIELIYCPTDRSCVTRQIQVQNGSTAGQAIEQSALLSKIGLTLDQDVQIGIYGKQCQLDTPLNNLDRIEIDRPLLLSPTEARRLRAQTLAEK